MSLNIVLRNVLDVLFVLQSYLIGWEEFRMNKWLIGYIIVIAASVIDWMLSVSMMCNEVSTMPNSSFQTIPGASLEQRILDVSHIGHT